MCKAERPNSRGQVMMQFAALCAGTLFCYAGYYVVLTLQSSINISEGLGALSLTATYVTSAFCGLFFSPFLLQTAGPKICLILCEVNFMLYILANYYPKPYTLIPAAILNGFAEATMWPANMLYCFQYAREYSQWGSKNVGAYTTQFTGILFSCVMSSGLLGYSLSQVIFFGGISGSSSDEKSFTNISSTFDRDLSVCGINDCQDPNVTEANIGSYRPASEFLLNLLLGVMAGLVAVGFTIHAVFLGKYVSAPESEQLEMTSVSNKPINIETSKETDDTFTRQSKVEQKAIFKTVMVVKEVFSQLTNPRQLLIAPMVIYYGMLLGLWMTDYNRAFVSCMQGVEKIGFFAIVSTVCSGLVALSIGAIASRTGRSVPFLFIFLLDLGWYSLLLLWTPTKDSLWVIYVVSVITGFDDGIWTTLTNEMYGCYFPHNQAVSFTVWSLFMTIGVAWQTGWSSSLCVDQKIYFQIGMLCFAMLCYQISLCIYGNKPTKAKSHKSEPVRRISVTKQL